MLRITGYSDKYSLRPGDTIKFYVNSEHNEDYEMQMVRLIHGDTNPEGPGYKEEEIASPCNQTYTGQKQRIHGGSYVIIPQENRLNVDSFTLQAYIFPTTPEKGNQGILTKWVESTDCGYGLFVDGDSCLCAKIGDGNGQIMKLSSGKKLMRKVWYLVAASFDADTSRVVLYQEAATPYILYTGLSPPSPPFLSPLVIPAKAGIHSQTKSIPPISPLRLWKPPTAWPKNQRQMARSER